MSKPSVVLIVGPTGTGKTRYSVEVAKALNTEIVSCDSMQIYKKMNIGTAKVTPYEAQGIKHHMIDIAEPWVNYSACNYVQDASKIVEDINQRGKIPLVVGGTGLYASSLINGTQYFEASPKDEAYRNELKLMAEQKGAEYMHSLLKDIDPESYENIHPNNVKRVIRALEYYHLAGESISEHNRKTKEIESPYHCLKIGFYRDRQSLYDRINKRVDAMLKMGLVDEVKGLVQEGVGQDTTAMQAIGYKEVCLYLDGQISYDELVQMLKQSTRRYAKRQMTWFNADKEINWINLDECDETEVVCAKCVQMIQKEFG